MAARRLRAAEPATLVFAGAALFAGVALLVWLSDLTFWRDEWDFLLHRRGFNAEVYFDPFVEHLLALSIGIYQLTVAIFGMESAAPTQVVAVALFITAAALLFVYLRRRVDAWLALAGVLPILFFGPSWDDLLFPFQMAFFGSMACGIGALLALDGESRRGDVIATALLTVGLLFSGLGVPFVVMAVVDIALTRERFQRAFVVVVPTALYALWYLRWGRDAETFISFHNFQTLLGYVSDGLASSLSSLLGLGVSRDEMSVSALDWGRPLLVIAVGFAVWRIARAGLAAMPRRLWAVVAGQLVFWSLTGLNASFFGQATSGRYQLLGAAFWVMIAAELLRGVAVRRWILAVVLSVSVLAALANFSLLNQTAGGLAGIAEKQRGGLAALELARAEVDPAFLLTEENSGVDYLGFLDAGSYFSAIDAHGSPAYTADELAGASDRARMSADKVSAAALRIGLEPVPASTTRACAPAPSPGSEPIPVPPGGTVIRAGSEPVRVSLRRYADHEFPVRLGTVAAGAAAALAIPEDASSRPWRVKLDGAGSTVVCPLGAGA